MTSTNGQILWAAGKEAVREIWRFVPGSSGPERLFVSPRDDSNITAVVSDGAAYAFVEESRKSFGEGGWRVWYLSSPTAEPIELDRGRAPNAGAAPTIAMDGDRIVWAAFDEPASGPVSRLRVASISNVGRVATLLTFSAKQGLLWYPVLNGTELWYAIIHPDFEETGARHYQVEMLDIGESNSSPVEFAGVGNDFNPAVNDAFVAFKTGEGDSAALNWGDLNIFNRQTLAIAQVPVKNVNRPSIGDRFITMDEIFQAHLWVFDPTANQLTDLLPEQMRDTVTVGGESLSGRLLAFYADNAPGKIGWAILPQ